MLKALGILAAIVATLGLGYFVFRPKEARQSDWSKVTDRVTGAYHSAVEYGSKLFHTEKGEAELGKSEGAAA